MSIEGREGNNNEDRKEGRKVIPFPSPEGRERIRRAVEELKSSEGAVLPFPRREQIISLAAVHERVANDLIQTLYTTIGEMYMDSSENEEFKMYVATARSLKKALADMKKARRPSEADRENQGFLNQFEASVNSLHRKIEEVLPRLGFEHD